MSQTKHQTKIPTKQRPPRASVPKSSAPQPASRRGRRLRRNQLNEAQKLLQEAGVKGTDVRSPSVASPVQAKNFLQVPATTPSVPIKAIVKDRAISYLAMGIVLRAIKHGALAAIQGPADFPYYSFRYLIDAFTSAMLGTIPAVQAAPKWFWNLCYALKKKSKRFKTGSVTYEWSITETGAGNDQIFTLGTNSESYAIFWGTIANAVPVNGYVPLTAVAAYTAELGSESISRLFSFFEESGLGKMEGDPGSEKVWTGSDTSAFSVCYPELGSSYFSPGALRTTIYSEANIDSPLLAKFAEYQPVDTPWFRGWHKADVSGGTSCYTGARMTELSTLNDLRNKTPPNFKIYNFDEIFQVLSLSLCMAMENAVAAGGSPLQCPLTCQNAQILLRQAIIGLFCNDMAQDMRLSGEVFIDLLPFTVGPNGCPPPKVNMLIPTCLAENIRAMNRIVAKLRGGARTIIDLVPVLARPSPEEHPQFTGFEYLSGQALYAPPGAEVPINIIDCSATVDQSTVYLDVSRNELTTNCELWNKWISTFEAFLSPLVIVGSEMGISALNTNLMTNFYQDVVFTPDIVPEAETASGKKRGSSKRTYFGSVPNSSKVRSKLSAVPNSGSDYLMKTGDKQTSSELGFNPALWNYLGLWVLPCAYALAETNEASVPGWQTFHTEPYRLVRSTVGGVGGGAVPESVAWPTVFQRNHAMAVLDVKTLGMGSQQNEMITGLIQLGKEGRGGFFTSIASMIGDAVGIPEVRKIATAIGNVSGL